MGKIIDRGIFLIYHENDKSSEEKSSKVAGLKRVNIW